MIIQLRSTEGLKVIGRRADNEVMNTLITLITALSDVAEPVLDVVRSSWG